MIMVVIFASRVFGGTTWYVAPSGNDNNPGRACSPFRSIQKGIDVAKAGDTVVVGNGTYSENLISIANGTAKSRIRYMSAIPWGAKIVTSAGNGWSMRGDYEDLVGFDISSKVTTTNQLIHTSGLYDRIVDNRIHDMSNMTCMSGAGILFGSGSGYNEAIGNYVFNIGEPPSARCNQTHGVYVSTSNNIIKDNIIFDNGDLGIHVYGSNPSNNFVANNIVFGNWRGIVIGGTAAPATGNCIQDNILYKNLDVGMYETARIGVNSISNNLNYLNGKDWGLTNDKAVNTLAADPQFIDFTGTPTGDYRLKSTSPASYQRIGLSMNMADLNAARLESGQAREAKACHPNHTSAGNSPTRGEYKSSVSSSHR
jgi:parallel beta-helix repeat protein